MIELEEKAYMQKKLIQDSQKCLAVVESQALKIKGLKESISKEILQLKT